MGRWYYRQSVMESGKIKESRREFHRWGHLNIYGGEAYTSTDVQVGGDVGGIARERGGTFEERLGQ